MGRRGRDLAERFRAAIEASQAEERRRDEERQRRLEEGRSAREKVLVELEEFGKDIGFLAVDRNESGLTLRYGERFLHFEPMGEGDRLRVSYEGMAEKEDHRLYREPSLNNKWVWVMTRRGREDRLPLFETGLEELMVISLDLPRPALYEPPPAAETLEDAMPHSEADEEIDAADRKRTL